MFDRKGSILIDKTTIDEEKLMDLALEAGAEDVVDEESEFLVLTEPDDFEAVREALQQEGVKALEASIGMIPQNVVEIKEEKVAKQVMRLLDNLDFEDVQNVYANFDIDESLLES
jgi:transcriptional/translational regulatory protein YebC/TACO1